jgi:hypothetical protein
MAFAFLFAGILLLTSGVRGTQDDLFAQIKSDFTGQGNFVYWATVCLIIGAIGYWKPLRPISHAFLVLIIIVLLLKRGDPNGIGGGFFSQFFHQLDSTKAPAMAIK